MREEKELPSLQQQIMKAFLLSQHKHLYLLFSKILRGALEA